MQKSRTKILEKSKMGRFFLRIEALPKLLFKFITTGLRVMGKVLNIWNAILNNSLYTLEDSR